MRACIVGEAGASCSGVVGGVTGAPRGSVTLGVAGADTPRTGVGTGRGMGPLLGAGFCAAMIAAVLRLGRGLSGRAGAGTIGRPSGDVSVRVTRLLWGATSVFCSELSLRSGTSKS